jgi:cytochrome c oxidase subunit 2
VSVSACSTSDLESKLRFGFPTGVTKQAERIRELWTWSSVVALVMGVLVWGLIFWSCGRYHKKADALPRQTKYNLPLEFAYTIVPLIIVSGLFYFTVRTEDFVDKTTANPDVVLQVNAFKWNWQFEYHSYHGQDTRYTTSSAGTAGVKAYVSTVGTSTQIPVLVVPRGQTVRVIEHSLDVIHSFWVPEFLFKRDVIPYGPEERNNEAAATNSATNADPRDNQFEFTATVDGSYVGRCAELCGTYHSQMNFEVRVVEPADFQTYVNTLAALGPDTTARQPIALTAIGGSPCATTTHPFDTTRDVRSASTATGVCQ